MHLSMDSKAGSHRPTIPPPASGMKECAATFHLASRTTRGIQFTRRCLRNPPPAARSENALDGPGFCGHMGQGNLRKRRRNLEIPIWKVPREQCGAPIKFDGGMSSSVRNGHDWHIWHGCCLLVCTTEFSTDNRRKLENTDGNFGWDIKTGWGGERPLALLFYIPSISNTKFHPSTNMFKSALVALAGLSQLVSAHYYLHSVNGDTSSLRPLVLYNENSPVTAGAIETSAIACGANAASANPAPSSLSLTAGSKVTATYDTMYHLGPCFVYASSDNGKSWAKIWEDAYNTNGAWCSDRVTANNNNLVFTIPSQLPSGKYVIRVEQIGLHVASTPGGAQVYVRCFDANISGGGSSAPSPTVSFPGMLSTFHSFQIIKVDCCMLILFPSRKKVLTTPTLPASYGTPTTVTKASTRRLALTSPTVSATPLVDLVDLAALLPLPPLKLAPLPPKPKLAPLPPPPRPAPPPPSPLALALLSTDSAEDPVSPAPPAANLARLAR
uniref:lytic cellulose monooxygenase (C4-dehydrogenating) n=1 Tax=Rhizophlyctis rosea TaxID=64517 RepID=A0A2U8U9Q9_9FUNG|nr:lytic polysaccharide monooxygenase 9 [Rhizophlyctis rosea]